MSRDDLALLLNKAGVELLPAEGWQELPEGRSLTLHIAHNGAAIALTQVQALQFTAKRFLARSERGEVALASMADVFAASVAPPRSGAGQAGFR